MRRYYRISLDRSPEYLYLLKGGAINAGNREWKFRPWICGLPQESRDLAMRTSGEASCGRRSGRRVKFKFTLREPILKSRL